MHPIIARRFTQSLISYSEFIRSLLSLLVVFWISSPHDASAEQTFPITEFSNQNRSTLRWEAIERGPDILSGNQPQRSVLDPIPYFRFNTDEMETPDWTLFKVPANASVRFFIKDIENLNQWPENLEVRISQGSALFQGVQPEPVLNFDDFKSEKGSLFELPPPTLGSSWMVWVLTDPDPKSLSDSGDLSWAAFISKTERTPELELKTATTIEGEVEKKTVLMDTASGHLAVWWLLKPGEAYQMQAAEGRSIDLVTRFPLPPSDTKNQFFYSVQTSWIPDSSGAPEYPTQTWNVETRSDSRHAFKYPPFTAPWIGNKGMVLVGRERIVPLISVDNEIQGTWKIRSDQAIWVRALVRKEPGFLFEEQNSPRPGRKAISEFPEYYGKDRSNIELPLELQSTDELFNELTSEEGSPISNWRKWTLISRLLDDPSRTDGGLIAAALAESWARNEPELLSWTQEAIDLQSRALFYRSLPPSSPSMASTLNVQELGYLSKNHLRTGDSWSWAYQKPTPTAAETAPIGIFSDISESGQQIHYHWKSVQAPRALRLALGGEWQSPEYDLEEMEEWPSGYAIEFTVTSFPSGQTQSLYWTPGLALNGKAQPEYSPDQRFALRNIEKTGASSWFQPVLGPNHHHWIPVDTLEWKVPPGDSYAMLQMGQKRDSDDFRIKDPIKVMMSATDSRSARLGESDTTAKAGPNAWQDFWKEFWKLSIREGIIDTPKTTLIRDWIPVFRRLNSLNAHFHAGIRPKRGTSEADRTPLLMSEYQAIMQKAISLEADGNWLEALESWSRCRMAESEEVAESAWEGTLRCLNALDEPLLRNRILKGLCAYPPTNVRAEWIQELQDNAIQEAIEKGEDDEVTLWLARRWIREPDFDHTKDWLAWLNRSGHAEEALKISKLAPADWNFGEPIIEAAFEAQWLSTLNEHLELQPESVRKFWLGIQACYEQDWNRALHLWNDLHEHRARKWKRFISESLRLKHQWATIHQARLLENHSVEEKSEAERQWLSDWRRWTDTYPGPVTKSPEMDGWLSVSGLGYLYSAGRDLLTPVAMISPESPARYKINYGDQLFLRIRPLAETTAERSNPVQLTIRYSSGESETILVPDSPVSTGLTYIGPGEGLPAAETLTTLQLPTATENISTSSIEFEVQGGTLLVRVESEIPIYDLAAIPLLQRKTFNAWNVHRLNDSFLFQRQNDFSKQPWVSRRKQIAYENPLQDPESKKHFNTITDSQLKPTQGVEETDPKDFEPDTISDTTDWASWKRRASEVLLNSEPEEIIAEEAALKQFEIQSRQNGNADSDFSKTLDEIGQSLMWERIRQVESSAGIHKSAALGILPTSPAMRVRQALFETPRNLDGVMLRKDVIHWASAGGLEFSNSKWNIELRMLLVYYWETDPAEVFVHNSSGDVVRKIQLNPALWEQNIQIPLNEDTRQIGFSIPNRKTQQFIEVVASIKTASTEGSDTSEVIQIVPEIADRTFHVASEESPIRHRFRSPSWIRIYHLSGSNLTTEWRFITDPDGRLELRPKPGESKSYYRLYKRTLRQLNPPGTIAGADSELSEPEIHGEDENTSPKAQVPPIPSWGSLNGDVFPESNLREDSRLRPGRQEDGTWEFHGRGYQRRNIEESTSERFAERFLQFSAERRWHAEHWRSYFRASALHRFREHGGSTLGVGADWNWNPQLWGGSLTLGGDLYQQKPGGSQWNPHDSEESEWAGRLELTAARRYGIGEQWSLTPSITGWLRGLSLKHSGAFSSAEIDRDIFTPYKQDHQHGIRLGGTLRWDPTLDQQFWTRLSISSNEDWNLISPDYYSGQIGWRVIRGSMEAELRYRNVYFQADEDRNQNTWRHFIESRASWSRWRGSSNRWKTQVMFSYDLMASEWTGWLGLSYLWSEGRRLKDYRPSETWFENIWENRLRE